MITLTILATVGVWNEFLHPLIVANRNEMRTLPVGLSILRQHCGQSDQWNTIMMASVIVTIPMAIIYLIQRYFRQGLSGAVKG